MSGGYGVGRSIGASLQGYYEGRTARLNAKDRDVDRERDLKLRDTYDPIELETALLTLDRAKRTGELEEFMVSKGIPQNRASRQEEIDIASQGPKLRGIPIAERAAVRSDQMGEAQQQGSLDAAEFSDRYSADQREDYDANSSFWDKFGNMSKAVQSFRMTGNPKIITDAYELYMDDGYTAKISKIPAKEKGGAPRYIVDTNNPDAAPAEFDSKEELAAATEQIFMSYLEANQPRSAYGVGPFSGGMGNDPYSGRRGGGGSGRRGGSGREPAAVQTADYIYDQMAGNPDFEGLSEQQLRLRAWAMANYSKEGSPRKELANFFKEVMAMFLKPPAYGKPMSKEDARAASIGELKWYRDTFYPGAQLNIPKAGGGGESGEANPDYMGVIDRALEQSRAR